jgi:transcriptional regulator with XRE-family HTH domain
VGTADERSSRVAKESRRYRKEIRTLGLRIRELRQDRRWILEQAAERMDLDLKHLQKIEAGQLNVTFVTLVRIAAGLKIEIRDLFEEQQRRS